MARKKKEYVLIRRSLYPRSHQSEVYARNFALSHLEPAEVVRAIDSDYVITKYGGKFSVTHIPTGMTISSATHPTINKAYDEYFEKMSKYAGNPTRFLQKTWEAYHNHTKRIVPSELITTLATARWV